MKTLVCLLVAAVVVSVSASPIDQKRILINKPSNHEISRTARSPQDGKLQFYTKGDTPNPKPDPPLRKGEYICGDKVCRLQPGEIPRGCDGRCQYRVH